MRPGYPATICAAAHVAVSASVADAKPGKVAGGERFRPGRGAGTEACRAATSAAISGASNILLEAGPEGLDAAAQRTAKEIAREIVKAYEERGWL